jgi:hypothetical protein
MLQGVRANEVHVSNRDLPKELDEGYGFDFHFSYTRGSLHLKKH